MCEFVIDGEGQAPFPVVATQQHCRSGREGNVLFLLARFSDQAWLHWLWQSRVVQSDPELVRAKFPRYVLLAMPVITPIGKLRVMAMDARKKHK